MLDHINLHECSCSCCGKALFNEISVSRGESDTLLCRECSVKQQNGSSTVYMNIDGVGYPVITDSKAYELSMEYPEPVICSGLREYNGKLSSVTSFPKNAIIVIELPTDERSSPQETLFENSADMSIQRNFAMRMRDTVVVRKSRISDRLFIFIKTKEDTPEKNFEAVCELGRKLETMHDKKGRCVYMEHITGDDKEHGKTMIARSGMEGIYFKGTDADNNTLQERRFKLEFSFAEMLAFYNERIIGQKEEMISAVYLVYEFIDNISLGRDTAAAKWMLTAPSGSGKTEFFRVTEEFFKKYNIPIPVLKTDLSHITESGYKGRNVEQIIDQISKAASSEYDNAAICFLDEADKKFVPSYTSRGDDVNAAVQANLLTMIEGSVMTDSDNDTFDTTHIMFVFLGAFQKIRDNKKEICRIMLEGLSDCDSETEAEDAFYDDISREDMVKSGMLDELAGRLKMVVNFHKVSKDDMRSIISEKCRQVEKAHNCQIELTDKAYDDFLDIAYTNYGIRSVINKLDELSIRTISRKLTDSDFNSEKDILVIEASDKAHIRSSSNNRPVRKLSR